MLCGSPLFADEDDAEEGGFWFRSADGVINTTLSAGTSLALAQAQDSSETDYCEVDDFVGNDHLVRADDALLIEIQHDSSNSLQIHLLPLRNAASPYKNQKFTYSKVKLVDTQCGSGFISYLEGLPDWSTRYILPVQTRTARLFARQWDVVVTLAPSTDARGDFCTDVAASGQHPMNFTIQQLDGSTLTTLATVPVDINPQKMQMAIADFDADGLDDIFVVNESSIWVSTSADPADPSKGITEVASLALPAAVPGGRNAPRVGNLDDDGNLDVAWISGGTVADGQLLGERHHAQGCVRDGLLGAERRQRMHDDREEPRAGDRIPVCVGGPG